jgi:hypothetical protein
MRRFVRNLASMPPQAANLEPAVIPELGHFEVQQAMPCRRELWGRIERYLSAWTMRDTRRRGRRFSWPAVSGFPFR